MKSIEKFLDFNGGKVYFLAADGQWWIAIKPICEALGVDFERQRKNLKADPILGQLPSVQTVVAVDGKSRKMVCLPEFHVYGWLFKLRSSAEGFEAFQWKCYELLYNYFHGSITDRNKYLKERTTSRAEAAQLRKALGADPNYTRLQELQGRAKSADKALKQLDQDLVASQMPLWNADGSANN